MAPKSQWSILAQRLKDQGRNRHQARFVLQKEFGRQITPARISQLLADYWGPEADDTRCVQGGEAKSSKDVNANLDRETMTEAASTGNKRKRETTSESDTTDSSILRSRARLSSKKS